jgi:hypothetical protein
MAAVQIAFDFDSSRAGAARFGWGWLRKTPAPGPVASTPLPHAPVTASSSPARAQDTTRRETSAPAAATDHEPHTTLGLEAQLRASLGRALRLTLTDNRRTMISLRKRPGFTELRLHHMFLRADASTVAALCNYVGHGDRDASLVLGRYIEQHREGIRRRPQRVAQLSTSGVHHDLLELLASVNGSHFDGRDDVRITWGRDPQTKKRRARRSIKLGSYCSRDRLIRVHPTLDAEFVPRYFVEYIIYHEMLHHVLPPVVRGGRRQLHGRDFKRLEQQFPLYAQALRWESDNLDRLLRR